MEWEWLREFGKRMIRPLMALSVAVMGMVLAHWQQLGLVVDTAYSILRGLIQISAIGFVLQFLMHQQSSLWILAYYLVMVETALALGATPRQAMMFQVKRSVIVALSPALDNANTLVLVTFPGGMTGMMLAGPSPMEAIKLQLVIMNLIIGAATLCSITSTYLSRPCFFTEARQLRTNVLISD